MKVVAGVEPSNAGGYDDSVDASLREAVQAGKVHAIGPCGFEGEADEAQTLAFERQVAIANEFDLPLIVQANGAHDKVFSVLEAACFPFSQVLVRAFAGEDEELRKWSQAGCYVSFGGWSADDPVEFCRQVQLVPIDRVLVESAAPEQTIDQLAGLPARCDQVVFVADAIISIVPAAQLAQNTATFYRL